ncbi:interferon-induced, double-stranded RNA-activated protein kinase isoform X2 [Megalops cyprinoides]|uniref:interferon-induced, double-stranded RNA-activated protein kinase isoform X2 n=1 Tax=Megalops cyprinoides TaxID=118141 RepID=UPI001865617C|nr:interferon-induced, double-stranded RNA-activated protein kinase isoform X2 [Megalops cyprinoides]
MDMQNYVPRLNEYAQKARLNLRYEDVGTEGPDHCRTFTMRVVMNNQVYPDGVGRNKKEAKQNAAKNALEALMEESVQQNDSVTSPRECPSPLSFGRPITQANYVCWLNEYSHKMRLSIKPIESARMGPGNTTQCCSYVVGEKQFPEAFGKTKKEAKEEAAKIVYQELCREQTTDGIDENHNEGTPVKNMMSSSVSPLCENFDNLTLTSTMELSSIKQETNYIGNLNTHCQKTKLVHDYKLVEKRGQAHNPVFVYKVVINKKEYPHAEGKTAKEAKQNAAQLAWESLQEETDWNSQVSCRSTVSDGNTSSTSSSLRDSQDNDESDRKAESTSESIIFKATSSCSTPKAGTPADVKPKRKLAVTFLMGNRNSQEKVVSPSNASLETSTGKTTNQPTNSRFLHDYDTIQRIGKGGFGNVFKAKRKLEDKYFAVKIVQSTKKALREVGALAELEHPHIVRYYTAWIEDTKYQSESSDGNSSTNSGSNSSAQYLYIQMELCEEGTLREWINQKNHDRDKDPKREKDALRIFRQIVEGVTYIHSKNLIHRDLKPLNILFGNDKGVKIGDFGLATFAECDSDESLLQRTKKTGTRSYMSPEQINQSIYDQKVDIFALGLIYFELLWRLTTAHEKKKVWEDVRGHAFPSRFCNQHRFEHKLIERMLSEKPEDRPDASEISSELIKYCTNLKKRQLANQDSNRTV